MTERNPVTPRNAARLRLFDRRTCDGHKLRQLTQAALTWLDVNHQSVNALNVFPVPDGDTGTNMLLTMQAAYKEVASGSDPNASRVAHAVAHGALMGARGNSGVILSQILRGFARGLDRAETFDAPLCVHALRTASDTAYRGVVRPVEGTILTVIKDVATAAEHQLAHAPQAPALPSLLAALVEAAFASVARTPDLLPVLKQAGVVDSGGQGLAIVLEGMLRFINGEPLDVARPAVLAPLNLAAVGAAMDAVEPGQEWEVIVDFRPADSFHLPSLYNRLEAMGTSIQVGEGDGLYRVHIHLLRRRRHEPIDLAEELGTVVKVHMENLLDQLDGAQGRGGETALGCPPVQPGKVGVVAISPGAGLSQVLASVNANAIVSGGQTMNPSTQDILEAVGNLATDRVIVLPNNKNIILAARQAAEMSVKKVCVVPSRTVPQGIAALMAFNPEEADLEGSAARMEAALDSVETGEVTTATRSVEIDGVTVSEGQIIGLHNGVLRLAGADVPEVVMRLLELMKAGDREVVDLYYGAGITAEVAEAQADAIRAAYPNLGEGVKILAGGQQHYHYIISAE